MTPYITLQRPGDILRRVVDLPLVAIIRPVETGCIAVVVNGMPHGLLRPNMRQYRKSRRLEREVHMYGIIGKLKSCFVAFDQSYGQHCMHVGVYAAHVPADAPGYLS